MRKVLTFVLLLPLLIVLFCPVVLAKEKAKKDLSFFKVHVPGTDTSTATSYTELIDPYTWKYVYSADCLIVEDNYVINIGGILVDRHNNNIWEFEGGTNFVLGEDFTYTGHHEYTEIQKWIYWEGEWGWKTVYVSFTIIGTYDFTLLGIDGTIEFYQIGQNWTSPSGELTSSSFSKTGYGTGELEGVTLEAGRGHLIYTEETGVQYATAEGTIYGWPKSYLKIN